MEDVMKIIKKILIIIFLLPSLIREIISFTEWLNIGFLKKTDDYPWGCEGLPWYYESPEKYSGVWLTDWITNSILIIMIFFFLKYKKYKEFKFTLIALIIYYIITFILFKLQMYTFDFSPICNP